MTAIILKGDFDKDKAKGFDLFPTLLDSGLSLFHIDHYYSACWQHKLKISGKLDISNIDCIVFPNEIVISEIIKNISSSENPEYAIIPFWLLNQDMQFHGYNCFLNYTSLIPAYAGIPFFKGG